MLKMFCGQKTMIIILGTDDEPLQFIDALCNNLQTLTLLGYLLVSSAINVLSLGFANFIHKRGKMRNYHK
jgi:hypothetical protein